MARKHFFQRLWERILRSRSPAPRLLNGYSLDIRLTETLRDLAEAENRSPGEIAADLIVFGLAQQNGQYDLYQRWQKLSPREQDVAALICLHYTNRQIARHLYLSENTVRTHSHNVMVKFAVNNRADLRRLLDNWDFSAWNK
jgi:DNA-binding CsgD family transcriptional regulator